MEIGCIKEGTYIAEKTAAGDIPTSFLEQDLESVILKYAIRTFPFSSAFENVPGYRQEELPELIQRLISAGIVKIGFYYEEMQDDLTIFYFLRLTKQKHLVLGLDPKEISVFISNVNGIFRLSDEQYVNLLKIPLC